MTESMKKCPKCGEVKPLSEYHKNKNRKDGLQVWCKSCRCVMDRKYRKANSEKIVKQQREWYMANSEKVAKQCRKYRECVKNPCCPNVGQNGAEFIIFVCEVCGKEFRRLAVAVSWEYEHNGRLPRFCSRECQNASKRKGWQSPYTRKIKEIIKRESS